MSWADTPRQEIPEWAKALIRFSINNCKSCGGSKQVVSSIIPPSEHDPIGKVNLSKCRMCGDLQDLAEEDG